TLEEELTIGRARSNALVLSDDDVSRQHARVRRDGGAFILADLGSRHGTHIHGERITERRLQPGDRIRIGENTLVFSLEEPERLGDGNLTLDDDAATEHVTVELRLEDARYLKADAARPAGDERT